MSAVPFSGWDSPAWTGNQQAQNTRRHRRRGDHGNAGAAKGSGRAPWRPQPQQQQQQQQLQQQQQQQQQQHQQQQQQNSQRPGFDAGAPNDFGAGGSAVPAMAGQVGAASSWQAGMRSVPAAAADSYTGRFDVREGADSVPQAQLEKMIRDFKTMPCAHGNSSCSHDHRCCPFFHSDRDRRRTVVEDSGVGPRYCAEPCNEQFDTQRCCSRGDDCKFCHSTAELLYHPDVFRKRLCYQAKRCPRGRYCAFAHSRQELLVPHFGEAEEADPSEEFIAHRFKTQWCPIGGPHDWENCVYAHTYRDWRRTPLIGYSSRPCPQWTRSIANGSPELNYDDRCPRGMACPLAHGSKEQLYHPQFYKTSPCSETFCKRGSLCAFTHGPHDTRHPSQEEDNAQSAEDHKKNVMELLERYQPTFWNPPKYHQLEDPGRGSPGFMSASYSKGRGQRRRAAPMQTDNCAMYPDVSQGMMPASPVMGAEMTDMGCGWGLHEPQPHELPMYPVVMPPSPGMQGGPPQNFIPEVYQWVPCAESPTQQMHPLMAYGDMGDAWGLQMGYTPMVWGDPTFCQGSSSSSFVHESQQPRGKNGKGKTEQGKTQHSDYYLRRGMRTPSSLGSPPLSATPTEAPSPRPEEPSAGSGEASSDDTAREQAAANALHPGPLQMVANGSSQNV